MTPTAGVAPRSLLTRQNAAPALRYALLLAMAGMVVTRIWSDHPWAAWGLVAVTVAAWLPVLRTAGLARWWFVYVAGIFVYTILRSYADETAIAIRTDYVIDIDRWLFLGNQPLAGIQERLFDPDSASAMDVASVLVHWSFFLAPHALAVWVAWRHPAGFPRYAALVAGTMYAGLLLFFLVPTVPPWLAGAEGSLPGVVRIMDYVGGAVAGDRAYDGVYASLGEPNSVAAMPSIHIAVTFAMWVWARWWGHRLAPWLLPYTAVMAAALWYLGEHYVADMLAGIGCVLIVWAIVVRFIPASSARDHAALR